VTRVLEQYFVLEEPVAHHSADPFASLLFSVLTSMGVFNGRLLKTRLRDGGIEPHCLEKFAIFRESFPIDGSFESFVLPYLLKNIQRHEIAKMVDSSTLSLARRFLSFILIDTLVWIGKLGRRKNDIIEFRHNDSSLPPECGYSYLTLIFCMFLWTWDKDISYMTWEDGLSPDILLELFRDPGLTEMPFILIALGETLAKVRYYKTEHTADDKISKQWVIKQLIRQPQELERGITMFLRVSRNFISRIANAIDEELADALKVTGEEISRYMAAWVIRTLPLHETFRLAHTISVTSDTAPHSLTFWSVLHEYSRLQGFDDLLDRHGKEL
jgi:hypothetical protein